MFEIDMVPWLVLPRQSWESRALCNAVRVRGPVPDRPEYYETPNAGVEITKNKDRSQMDRKTVSWEIKYSVSKVQQEGS